MKIETLQDSRRLAHVPRWSVVPVIRRQYVAEHSYNVAMLAWWIADELKIPPHKVIEKALMHDTGEAITGDLPSPVKGRGDVLGSTLEEAIVKLADYMDAYLYTSEEEQLGNTCLQSVCGYNWAKCDVWFNRVKSFMVTEKRDLLSFFELLLEALEPENHPVHRDHVSK